MKIIKDNVSKYLLTPEGKTIVVDTNSDLVKNAQEIAKALRRLYRTMISTAVTLNRLGVHGHNLQREADDVLAQAEFVESLIS